MRSRWVTWNGTRILYGDFAGFERDVDALRTEVEAVDREMCSEPQGSVLALADLRGTVTSSQVVELFKHSATLTKPYVRKQAVIGIGGLQRFLAQMVARFSGQGMRLFETEDEAMRWLAGETHAQGIVVGDA